MPGSCSTPVQSIWGVGCGYFRVERAGSDGGCCARLCARARFQHRGMVRPPVPLLPVDFLTFRQCHYMHEGRELAFLDLSRRPATFTRPAPYSLVAGRLRERPYDVPSAQISIGLTQAPA